MAPRCLSGLVVGLVLLVLGLVVGPGAAYVNSEGIEVSLVDNTGCPDGLRRFQTKCWSVAKARDVAKALNLTSSSKGVSQAQAAAYCSSLSRRNQTVSLGAPASNAEWSLVRRMLLAAGLGNDPFSPQKGTGPTEGINNTVGSVNFAPAFEWAVIQEKLAWLGFQRNRDAGSWAAPSGETLPSTACPANLESFNGYCYEKCPAGAYRLGSKCWTSLASDERPVKQMTSAPWTSGQPDDVHYNTAAMVKIASAAKVCPPEYRNPFYSVTQLVDGMCQISGKVSRCADGGCVGGGAWVAPPVNYDYKYVEPNVTRGADCVSMSVYEYGNSRVDHEMLADEPCGLELGGVVCQAPAAPRELHGDRRCPDGMVFFAGAGKLLCYGLIGGRLESTFAAAQTSCSKLGGAALDLTTLWWEQARVFVFETAGKSGGLVPVATKVQLDFVNELVRYHGYDSATVQGWVGVVQMPCRPCTTQPCDIFACGASGQKFAPVVGQLLDAAGSKLELPLGIESEVWNEGQPAFPAAAVATIEQRGYLRAGALSLTAGYGQNGLNRDAVAPMLCFAGPKPVTAADCAFFTNPDASFLRCGCGFKYVNGICVPDLDVSKATLVMSAMDCLPAAKVAFGRNATGSTMLAVFARRVAQCVDPSQPTHQVDLASPVSMYAAAAALEMTILASSWPVSAVNETGYPWFLTLQIDLRPLMFGGVSTGQAYNSRGIRCSRLCKCLEQQLAGGCSPYPSTLSARALGELVLQRSRIDAICELYNPGTYPEGSFLTHATACALNARTSTTSDMADAVLSDIRSVAGLVRFYPRNGAGPSSVAEYVRSDTSMIDTTLDVLKARSFPQPQPLFSVPWFSTSFWADSSSTGMDAVTQYVLAFNSQLEAIQDAQTVLDDKLFLNGIINSTIAQAFTVMGQNAELAAGVVDAEQTVKTMDAREQLTATDKSLVKLREVQQTLLGNASDPSAPRAGDTKGSLGRVQDKLVVLINAATALERKQLEIARQKAITGMVFACFSLVLSCVSLGASGALLGAAKTGTAFAMKTAIKLDKVAKVAKTAGRVNTATKLTSKTTVFGPPGMPGSGADPTVDYALQNGTGKVSFGAPVPDPKALVAPVQVAIEENIGELGALAVGFVPIVGDCIEITKSAQVLQNYDGMLQKINDENKAVLAGSEYAFDQLRGTLGLLARTAISMSMTYLAAMIWFQVGSAAGLEGMEVPAELLDPVYLWTDVRTQIERLMTLDFGICPGENDANPYARRLLDEVHAADGDHSRALGGGSRSLESSSSGGSSSSGSSSSLLDSRKQTPSARQESNVRRSLGGKSNDKNEKAAASAAWQSLKVDCGTFFNDLENFTNYAVESQMAIVSAIEKVRYKTVADVASNAAHAMTENWQVAISGLVKNSLMTQDALQTTALVHTRAVAYAHAGKVVETAVNAISQLCASWFYSNPLLRKVAKSGIVTGVDILDDCSVVFTQPMEPVARVSALAAALASGTAKSWRSAMLSDQIAYSKSQNQQHTSRCDVKQRSFFANLFPNGASAGGSAAIDVLPASFLDDNNYWCMENAELVNFNVIFRDKDGKITPPPGGPSVQVLIDSDPSRYYYKYAQNGTTNLIEYGFKAPVARQISLTYFNPALGADCGSSQLKLPVGKGAEFVCSPKRDDYYDNGRVFSRLPPFGRWKISVGGKGWPANLPVPVAAEFALISAAVSCTSKFQLTDIVLSKPGGDPTARSGSVCGGLDYQRFAELPVDTATGLATWMYAAIAGGGALLILGAAGVGIHIKRRKAAAKSVGDALATTS